MLVGDELKEYIDKINKQYERIAPEQQEARHEKEAEAEKRHERDDIEAAKESHCSDKLDTAVERDYSDEELQDLMDNDAGYVGEDVCGVRDDGYHEILWETGNEKTAAQLDGFESEPKQKEFGEGVILKRYGDERGCNLTSKDTEYEELSMPVTKDKKELNYYATADKGMTALEERAEKKFGMKGGGDQYTTDRSVEQLVKDGYLRRLDPEEVKSLEKGNASIEQTEKQEAAEECRAEAPPTFWAHRAGPADPPIPIPTACPTACPAP